MVVGTDHETERSVGGTCTKKYCDKIAPHEHSDVTVGGGRELGRAELIMRANR